MKKQQRKPPEHPVKRMLTRGLPKGMHLVPGRLGPPAFDAMVYSGELAKAEVYYYTQEPPYTRSLNKVTHFIDYNPIARAMTSSTRRFWIVESDIAMASRFGAMRALVNHVLNALRLEVI